MDILTRSAIALLLILGGFGLAWLYQRRAQLRTPGLLPELGPLRPGAFVLVYFTTPSCAPCKTVQKPALREIQETLGEGLQVVEIDATEQPEMAQRWGVLSVPTTFVIDSRGQARHVNHGVARADKLLKQLNGL